MLKEAIFVTVIIACVTCGTITFTVIQEHLSRKKRDAEIKNRILEIIVSLESFFKRQISPEPSTQSNLFLVSGLLGTGTFDKQALSHLVCNGGSPIITEVVRNIDGSIIQMNGQIIKSSSRYPASWNNEGCLIELNRNTVSTSEIESYSIRLVEKIE